MKHVSSMLAAAIAAAGLLAAPAVHADGYSSVHARAFAAAEQGPEALRQFIQRTRMIHALNYADYADAIRSGPVPNAEVVSGVDAGDGVAQPEAGPEASQRAAEELREQIYRDMLFE